MDHLTLLFSGIIGLCLGSFINVIIFRFDPNKTVKQYVMSVLVERSHCDHCQITLSSYQLIPILSWCLLRGKCRHCQYPITIFHIITELAIALFCMSIIAYKGMGIWSIILISLGLIFIILAIIDLQYFLLPNCFTYLILISGLFCAYFHLSWLSLTNAIIGMLCGYVLLWVPATCYYALKKQVGLGAGDIKLLSALGTWISYVHLPLLVSIASLLGLIYFAVQRYLLYSHLSIRNRNLIIIPFGPCLLIAAYGCLLLLPTS